MPSAEECANLSIQAALAEERIKNVSKNQEQLIQEIKSLKEDFRDLREFIDKGIRAEVSKTVSIELSKEVKLILIVILLYLILGEKSIPLLAKLFNL